MQAGSQIHLSPAWETLVSILMGLCQCSPRLTHSTVLVPQTSLEQPFAARLDAVGFKKEEWQEDVRKLTKPVSLEC